MKEKEDFSRLCERSRRLWRMAGEKERISAGMARQKRRVSSGVGSEEKS